MWQLFYVAVELLLLGCDSHQDAAKKRVSGAPPQAHERTLQYTVAVDGSQTIQAILISNGKDAIDVAVAADSLCSLAGFMTHDSIQRLWPRQIAPYWSWSRCRASNSNQQKYDVEMHI